MVFHALSGLTSTIAQQNSWIVDSRATCHTCNDNKQFVELHGLGQTLEFTLVDDIVIKATMYGTVALSMRLPGGKVKREREYHSIHLKRHLLKSHNEGTWLTCNICQKFSASGELNEHLRRHKGVEIYTCSQCQKNFVQYRN